MTNRAMSQKYFNTYTARNLILLEEVCISKVNTVPRNVTVQISNLSTQCGEKSIYVFQELSVTSPLNPGCATNIGVFQEMQVTSNKQKHLVGLYLKAVRRTSSDHERENWIIYIVYSHIFPSQTKLTRSVFRQFNVLRWLTPQHWDPCLRGRGEQNQIPEPLFIKGWWGHQRYTIWRQAGSEFS